MLTDVETDKSCNPTQTQSNTSLHTKETMFIMQGNGTLKKRKSKKKEEKGINQSKTIPGKNGQKGQQLGMTGLRDPSQVLGNTLCGGEIGGLHGRHKSTILILPKDPEKLFSKVSWIQEVTGIKPYN